MPYVIHMHLLCSVLYLHHLQHIYMAGWAMQNTGRQKARETELAKLRNLGEESATPRKKVHILDMAFHHKETKGMWLQNDHVGWRWQESQI